jgi:hypothetical protein
MMPRDCIVFIPGIAGGAWIDQSVEGLSRRLASALDLNAQDPTAAFYSKVRAVEDLDACKGDVGTIYRKDDQGENAVIDIYKLDYRDTLLERYEHRNLLMKTLLLILALPGSAWRVLRAMVTGRSSKTRTEKIQLLYALGILFTLVIYVAILFSALWATISDTGRVSRDLTKVTQDIRGWVGWGDATPNTSAASAPVQSQTPSRSSVWLTLSQMVVVFGAVLSLFLPPKFNLKDRFSKAAVDYLCLIYYLKLGEQRNSIVGKLEVLIDELSRKSEIERKKSSGNHYRSIQLLAYSFGSIVALDALFPAGRKPGRPLQAVQTLVTIGCPFDFVRTLWTNYFDERREYEAKQPASWINVYSPLDVLGSNFRNDPNVAEASINIRSEQTSANLEVPAPVNVPFKEGLDLAQLSWASSLTLIGLRAHSIYWSATTGPEVNCFNQLVVKMYEGSKILA